MATHIEMPKLSDTMTEGTVVRWLKSVGDEVEPAGRHDAISRRGAHTE